MAGLQVPYTTPGGHQMLISNDHLDIARRLQQGDPTCAWPGDPRMFVVFNYDRERYEVWRRCEDNVDRIISSWVPREFDARVIVHTSQNDTRLHDVLERVDKHNEQLQRSRERELKQIEEELAKDIKWIKQKLYIPGEDAPRPRV